MTKMLMLVTALVAAPPNTKLLVNAEWLNSHLKDKNLVLIHVAAREGEFEKAHIPGAVRVTWGEYVSDAEGKVSELPSVEALKATFERLGVSDNSTVVIYGEPMRAARAFMTLEYLGHNDVRLLDGGLLAWNAAGYPTVTDAPAPKQGKLTPKPRKFVVDAAWVDANRTNSKYALIDARPLDEFTGSETHDGMHAGGHIPGAQNIYWERLIKSRAEPVFLSEPELRALFQRAGATDDKSVIVYCMIGMRASVAYFVSRYLGYDTKFYDGSWVDWSARQLPSVKGGEPVK
jgi:thiosulfate/3-mercaptopyruvate sulfurtransferase